MMRKPTEIEVLNPKASYEVPKYKVTEKGLEFCGVEIIRFVKGNKADTTQFRQEGLVTESLIEVVKMYLDDNNIGDLKNPFTTKMIEHLDAISDLIEERKNNRESRGVLGTYNK